jgi:hypothetical protein
MAGLQYQDIVNNQQGLTRDQLAAQAQAATVPFSPLPSLTQQTPPPASPPTQQSPTTQQQGTAPAGDPVTIFNNNLMQLLTRGQAAGNTAPLANEQNRLGVQQITDSMAPASQMGIDNLKPGDALNARQNAGQLYNPEIKNLTARMQAAAQNVANFTDAINAAKSFGESYATAIKPDEQTVKSLQDMLIAGETPPKAALDAAYKYIDWSAVAAGKKSSGADGTLTSDQKEYNQAVEQGYKGTLLQFVDRKSSGGGSPAETQAEKLTAAENKTDTILYSQRGSDTYVSPEAWYSAKEAWKADGFSAADFDKKFKQYTNPADPQDYGLN